MTAIDTLTRATAADICAHLRICGIPHTAVGVISALRELQSRKDITAVRVGGITFWRRSRLSENPPTLNSKSTLCE